MFKSVFTTDVAAFTNWETKWCEKAVDRALATEMPVEPGATLTETLKVEDVRAVTDTLTPVQRDLVG